MTGGTVLEGLDEETSASKGLNGGVVRIVYINAFLVPEGFQPRLVALGITWFLK